MIFCLNESRAVPSESSFSYTCISVADPELTLGWGGGGFKARRAEWGGVFPPVGGGSVSTFKDYNPDFPYSNLSLVC